MADQKTEAINRWSLFVITKSRKCNTTGKQTHIPDGLMDQAVAELTKVIDREGEHVHAHIHEHEHGKDDANHAHKHPGEGRDK